MVSSTFDIIGSLPVELAYRVLQYLESDLLVVSRRVSKGWNRLLTAEVFCKLLCGSRYDVRLDDKNIQICWSERFVQSASTRHALAYGRPWAKALHSCNLADEEFPKISYNDGLLAWYEHDVFKILDLVTGIRKEHSSNSYTPPQALQITKRFLVWFDSRNLRAYSLSTSRTSFLSLPGTLDPKNVAWDICEDTVIFIQPTLTPTNVQVTLWQIAEDNPSSEKSRESSSFTATWPCDFLSSSVAFAKAVDSTEDINLVVTSAKETFVTKISNNGVTKHGWKPDYPPRMWNYGDEESPVWEDGMTMGLLRSATAYFNYSEFGMVPTMDPVVKQILFSSPRKYVMRWVSLLTRRSQKSAILRSLIFGHEISMDGEQEHMVQYCIPVTPDTVYYAPINSMDNIRIFHKSSDKVSLHESDFHYDDPRFPSSLESNSKVEFVHRNSMNPVVHTIFIDEQYFILASKTHFEVYSFSKDAKLAEELEDYREGRLVRMRERLARKQKQMLA